MGAKLDHSVNEGHGPYVFKINGHCHHLMGSLLPTEGDTPKFAQLYVYDASDEISSRMSAFTADGGSSSLDASIVGDLMQMLDDINELVKVFRNAKQRLSCDNQSNYKLRLIGKRDDDSRQYDDPSSNDIGGLVVGDIGNFQSERDIIIEQCSGGLQRISKLHPKFMALQYPLLFPYGDDGYRCNMILANQDHQPQRKRSRVPMRAYYAYLIHERQFLVDAFANVEEDRLDYIRANQSDLRSEIYKGIHEAILREMLRDIRKYRPYKQEEKPDIVTRIFRAKVIDMIAYIKSGEPFGRTIADAEFKCRSAEDVDSIVSAEIPNKNTDPRRQQLDNFVLKDGIQLHNNYVVPYNKELLLRYRAHINVEICCQSMLIKYLFKYVSKGSDRCRMVVQKENNDEIKAYLNCRFICPYEAVWRLFQFPIHSRHPPKSCGVLYPTFQLACKSLGLLGDDKEWADALSEAILTATSPQIRQLFVSLNYVLYELELLFNASSTSLEKYKLPMPNARLLAEIRNKLLREELNYDIVDLKSQHSQLSQCLTSAKEMSMNMLLQHCIIWDSIFIVARRSYSALTLQNTANAPMNHRCCFEALDRSLRDILAHDQPFGGKTVLLGGDFRQILPVVTGEQRRYYPRFFKRLNCNYLLNGSYDRNGEISDIPFEDDYDTSLIKIPPDLLLDADSNPIASMVSSVYPFSMINDFIFNMLPENKHVYLSCDSVSTSSTDAENADLLYPVEFLNQLEFNGVPSHKLSLQVGTPIMLLRNLNPSAVYAMEQGFWSHN
uniref:ATP-dependent DNA helicase n=1 Tax=Salix viminalis TaxID=40686 RepID=A0A6N2LSJ9_SALVM